MNRPSQSAVAAIAFGVLTFSSFVVHARGQDQRPNDSYHWTGEVSAQTISLPSGDLADVYAPAIPRGLHRRFEDAFPLVVVLQGALLDKSNYSQFGRGLAAEG